MTELEKMQRAKMYIDKLANGVDPISGADLPFDAVLNNVRLSRCFFYVADVLRQVIDNGGEVSRGRRMMESFRITPEQIARVAVSSGALPITHLCNMINDAVGNDNMKKLSYRAVTEWLTQKGYLRVEEKGFTKRKRPGEHAEQIGIYEETRVGINGEFVVIMYSPDAQRFILDNLDSIVETNNHYSSRDDYRE